MQLTDYVKESSKYCASKRIFDEDLIQEVAISMWKSDQKFNGGGSIRGFRAQQASFALQDLFKIQKYQREFNKTLKEYYKDTRKTYYYNSIFDECKALLTKGEYELLEDYFIKNLTFTEMAKKYDSTPQTARARISRIISKLKSAYHFYQTRVITTKFRVKNS